MQLYCDDATDDEKYSEFVGVGMNLSERGKVNPQDEEDFRKRGEQQVCRENQMSFLTSTTATRLQMSNGAVATQFLFYTSNTGASQEPK